MTISHHTTGAARFGRVDVDVLAFHLHRYLAHWLAKTDRSRVFVTVGFEHSLVDGVTFEVARATSCAKAVAWTFDDLAQLRCGEDEVHLGQGEEGRLRAFPLTERSSEGVLSLLGFVVVQGDLEASEVAEVEVHLTEAIRAARRNGVRLHFDELDEQDMKALIYAALDHLPAWTGCDVAAALVLSHSLDAMTAEAAHESEFYVMAERLFLDVSDDDAPRLVGMLIDTRDEVRTVIDAAIACHQADPTSRVMRFRRSEGGYVDPAGGRAVSIGSVPGRPDDAVSLVAPLVVGGERELLGFLCLAFSGVATMPRSVEEIVGDLAERLAQVLRFSPLYTLSARRFRLLRLVRAACEAHVAAKGDVASLIEEVVSIVRRQADVPAFSVGWIERRDEKRHLVFPCSYGWTHFSSTELLVDVEPGERLDSGVAALAVRLGRPLVLAGGRPFDDHAEFKNYLFVHEGSGRICDARAPVRAEVASDPEWVRLGRYYKPARAGAYATVAHPVTFDGEPLGVVALEVDRETNWTWWTGYGGRLLWELVASELAFAFRSLGVG